MVSGEGWKEKEEILDFVYQLLKNNGHPLHYSVLMEEVWSRFPLPEGKDLVEAKTMFYTWINLDSRFAYMGQGQWGLRTWTPQKGSRRVPLLTLMHKTLDYNNGFQTRITDRERLREDAFAVDGGLLEQDNDADDREEFLNLEED
ncbi:MAG: DNA-directed RNA polymerase, delta subunit [Thermoanaerobacterales bacterium 50_218]|nr:MAG: DNA-directed RNA polymerase, delta subunit [Thermoanaerobacterales bacterium 50_218]HAA89183.1 DNA-directed RNA polymerase subunit delta [Peptococcaceae bacterium]